jgi:nucleoside-diphosphate kinase
MNLETKTEDKTGIKKEGEDKKPGLNEDIEQCEKSLIIIKPDGVQKKVVGDIISRFEGAGLEIERIRVLKMDKSVAYSHYREHEGKPYFDRLISYMTSGPSIIMIVKGKGAIKKSRELMGPTDPAKAFKGTIRGDYGSDITINSVHGSDCSESAQREINIFFGNYL